jgi:hypothetical protein
MPEISRFYGLRITMNINDHPPAHFHAEYGGDEAMVLIENGDLHRGYLPARAVRLVKEWALLHHNELLENWVRARAERPLFRIAPLP